jgi:hypothetical protein
MKLRPGGKLLIIVVLCGAIFLAFVQIKKSGLLDDIAAKPVVEQKTVAPAPQAPAPPVAVIPTPTPKPELPVVTVTPVPTPAPKPEPVVPTPPKKEEPSKGTGAADNVFNKIGKLQ